MAKIFYQLRQNKNVKSKIYGKWFAHSKSVETMNTRKLSQHISEHGSIYTPDVVFGVLEKFRSCLVEMLLESKSVKIDGLGTFYTTIENEPGGAAKEEDFNVQKNLKALHIRFIPEQEQELNISSREFIKKAEFVNVSSMKGEKKGTTPSGGGSQTPPQGDHNPGEGD
jgi:predicted histone-like DNA-binding protein